MVDARNNQIGAAIQDFMYRQLDAIYGRTAACIFHLGSRILLGRNAAQRVVNGDGMAHAALRTIWRHDDHVPKGIHDANQRADPRSGHSVIIGH